MKTSRFVERIGRAPGKEGGAEVWLEPGAGVAWPECGGAGADGHGLRDIVVFFPVDSWAVIK